MRDELSKGEELQRQRQRPQAPHGGVRNVAVWLTAGLATRPASARVHAIALCVLVLLLASGCEGDRAGADASVHSSDDNESTHGGSQGGGSGRGDAGLTPSPNAAGDADAASPEGTPLDPETVCMQPHGTWGSCTGGVCSEPMNDRAAQISASICLPALGSYPSQLPCSTRNLAGRCYRVQEESWFYHYTGDPAQLAASCDAERNVFCRYAPGVTEAMAQRCTEVCDLHRPDYTHAPECGYDDNCQNRCEQAAVGTGPSCAECIIESITWEAGGCNDWECHCPEPNFEPSNSLSCQAACEA